MHREVYFLHLFGGGRSGKGEYQGLDLSGDSPGKANIETRRHNIGLYSLGQMFTQEDNYRFGKENVKEIFPALRSVYSGDVEV